MLRMRYGDQSYHDIYTKILKVIKWIQMQVKSFTDNQKCVALQENSGWSAVQVQFFTYEKYLQLTVYKNLHSC